MGMNKKMRNLTTILELPLLKKEPEAKMRERYTPNEIAAIGQAIMKKVMSMGLNGYREMRPEVADQNPSTMGNSYLWQINYIHPKTKKEGMVAVILGKCSGIFDSIPDTISTKSAIEAINSIKDLIDESVRECE